MPVYKTLIPNPDFKPSGTAAEKKQLEAEYAAVVKGGAVRVATRTAQENLQNSKGMYIIEPEKGPEGPGTRLEDMDMESLQIMMLNLGATKIKPKMKKADAVAFIRRKLSEMEVDEEDEGSEE